MNIMPFLQRIQAFAPQQPTMDSSTPDSPNQTPDQTPLNPMLANDVSQMYQPSTAASSAYLNAAKALPSVNDYHPSRLRQIGAFLAGLGSGRPAGMYGGQPVGYTGNPATAQKTTEDALLAPYDIQLGDAENKLKPLQAAANLEMEQNNQARMSAALGIRADQGQQRLNQGQERIDQNASKIKAITDYDEARAWSERNPTYKFMTDANGNVFAFDSKDPSVMMQTGLNSGKLGDTQKAALGLQNSLAEINARKGAQLDIIAQQFKNAMTKQGKDRDLALEKIQKQLEANEQLKQTPGPDTETTTSSHIDLMGKNKTTTTTKKQTGPAGSGQKFGGHTMDEIKQQLKAKGYADSQYNIDAVTKDPAKLKALFGGGQ